MKRIEIEVDDDRVAFGGAIWLVAEVSVKSAAGYSQVRVAPERTQSSSVH